MSAMHFWVATLFVVGCSGRDPAREPDDAGEDELLADAQASEPVDATALDAGFDARSDDTSQEGGRVALDASGSTGADTGAFAATAACLESLRAQCDRRVECGLYASFDDCWQRSYRDCPDVFFSSGSARTVEGLRNCEVAWRQLSCEEIWRGGAPACAVAGTRKPEERCLFNAQCASTSCSVNGGQQCGVCRARRNQGETCRGATTQPCAAGLSCLDAGVCVSDPPRRFVALGGPCGSEIDDCGSNTCDYKGSRTCVPWPRLGEPCGQLGLCLGTDGSYCAASNVCQEAPGAGEPCAQNTFGQATCDARSECDATLVPPRCRALPRAGETCRSGCSDESVCRCVDAACSARRCLRARKLGESCDPNTFSVCDEPVSRCQDGVCVAAAELLGLFEKVCGR